MKGKELNSATSLHSWLIETYPNMNVGDKRPYKTLWRYLNQRGMTLIVDVDGDLAIVKRHQRISDGKKISLPTLLDDAERWAKAALREVKGCFRRECIEEDIEEIQMLKERCRSAIGRTKPLNSNFSRRYGQQQGTVPRNNPRNEFEEYADKITAMFSEKDDTSTLFASF